MFQRRPRPIHICRDRPNPVINCIMQYIIIEGNLITFYMVDYIACVD